MTTLMMLFCLVLSGSRTPEASGHESSSSQDETDQALAQQFATLKSRFEAREKVFHDELKASNKLEGDARSKKITEENQTFQRDWRAMAEEVRVLVRAHPTEPAAFDGIILLPGVMRSYLDDDLVKIVRDRFLNDPRMGRLCAPLASGSEDWSMNLLKDVAAKHPDRAVRGQATYSLGMAWRNSTETMTMGRDRTDPEKEQCLAEARRCFLQVLDKDADVISADGTFRLAVKARAELARIDNLPNLKVGKVAPEISGEDLDGQPLKLSDHRGQVVVICFWATWCGPCMAMVPHERELVVRMAGKPFVLLGVNSDEVGDRDKARKATRDKQMTWPSWWDGGFRGGIQTAYDVKQWPTVYVLDPQGVIRLIDVRDRELDQAVETLLVEMNRISKVNPIE